MSSLFQAALNRSALLGGTLATKLILLGNEVCQSEFQFQVLHEPFRFSETDLEIRFREGHELIPFTGPALVKPLLRYDFQKEWNNRGYGAVSLDSSSPFGLAGFFLFSDPKLEVIAEVVVSVSGEKVSDYAWVSNDENESQLWFNRAAGPIDGYDWVIVERFFSMYRQGDRECLPVVSEIPYGFKGAFTMRIDCDEAIASGRALFELYRNRSIPFGLAIKTAQPIGETDRSLMRDVICAGGSVVSHSHTHAPNWGGSREAALYEIRESQRILREQDVDGINYDYVVSPFHQNPRYAVEGLKDAGIRGFVGGIICNDPDFLMARAGQVPFVEGIISHSEQCMLHGETFHEADNSIEGFKIAFRQALETETFFGFLDHPFSQYWYGWTSEEERVSVHRQFIDFILSFPGVWRASLANAMNFFDMKSQVRVTREGGEVQIALFNDARFEGLPSLAVNYRGQKFELKPGGEVRFAI